MARKSNRAFTLVELIIVIAVIGVLAAILIPVFSNVVKKANIADKTSLARNLNTQIAAENEGSARVSSMGEAIAIAHRVGYTDDQLFNTTTAGRLVFNTATGNFAVAENVENGTATLAYSGNDDKTAPASSLFAAVEVNDMNDPSDFGMYLYEETESGREFNLTVSNSVDTGSLNVNTITFTSSEAGPFTISGNCETLTVNAPNAVVNHYGYANLVNITAVADQSYHEFGIVGVINITAGHLVIEASASVLTGVNVVDLANVTITLFAEAVISGGDQSQLQAIMEGGNPAVPWNVSTEELETIGFAAGSGTEADPYIIRTRKQLQNVSNVYVSEDEANGVPLMYFKVDPSVKEINCADWTPIKLYGHLDGSNVKIKLSGARTFINEAYCALNETITIKNFDIEANIVWQGTAAGVIYTAPLGNLVLENIHVGGYIEGSEVGGFVAYGSGQWNYPNYTKQDMKFVNCTNDATLVSTTGAVTGFVHHPFNLASSASAQNSSITIDNSKFTGNMACKNAKNFKYFASGMQTNVKIIGQNDCGVLYGTPGASNIYSDGSFRGGNSQTWDTYQPADKKTVITVVNGTGTRYEVFQATAKSGAAYATAVFQAAPNSAETGTGSFLATFMVEDLQLEGGKFTTEKIKFFDITVNGNATTRTGVSADGKTFNIVNDWYKTETIPGTVKIQQYDASGKLLQINTYSLPVG